MNRSFRFELVFSGLCLFDFDVDGRGVTVHLVDAKNVNLFQQDRNLKGYPLPRPHLPRLAYALHQQIRDGAPFRHPDAVVRDFDGQQMGVCDVSGEELSLSCSGAAPFASASMSLMPSLQKLSGHTLSKISLGPVPNRAVTSRLRIDVGKLEVLHLAGPKSNPLKVDFRPVDQTGAPLNALSTKIVEQIVLQIDGLTQPIRILSTRKGKPREDLIFPREIALSGRNPVVRVSLSNSPDADFPSENAAYDFLWLYEMVDFGRNPPPRSKLLVPVPRTGGGPFTGASGVCPPTKN